jgi:hypothetical protein
VLREAACEYGSAAGRDAMCTRVMAIVAVADGQHAILVSNERARSSYFKSDRDDQNCFIHRNRLRRRCYAMNAPRALRSACGPRAMSISKCQCGIVLLLLLLTCTPTHAIQPLPPIIPSAFSAHFVEFTAPDTPSPPYENGQPSAPFLGSRGERIPRHMHSARVR